MVKHTHLVYRARTIWPSEQQQKNTLEPRKFN